MHAVSPAIIADLTMPCVQMLADEVFVAAFARSPGKVQVTSGSNTVYEQDVPVGVTMMRVPMGPGNQDFHFTTNAGTDVKGTSAQSVRSSCIVSSIIFFLDRMLMRARYHRMASTIITSLVVFYWVPRRESSCRSCLAA